MRTLAVFAGAFSGGIFLCQYLLPVSWQVPAALVFFLATVGAVRFFSGNMRRRVLLVGVGLCLASGWNWLYIRQVQQPMEGPCRFTQRQVHHADAGRLCPANRLRGKSLRFGGRFSRKAAALCQPYLLELSPGQTVETSVTLESAATIHDEDVTTFTSKGIFLLAYEAGETGAPLRITDGSSASFRWWPGQGQARPDGPYLPLVYR